MMFPVCVFSARMLKTTEREGERLWNCDFLLYLCISGTISNSLCLRIKLGLPAALLFWLAGSGSKTMLWLTSREIFSPRFIFSFRKLWSSFPPTNISPLKLWLVCFSSRSFHVSTMSSINVLKRQFQGRFWVRWPKHTPPRVCHWGQVNAGRNARDSPQGTQREDWEVPEMTHPSAKGEFLLAVSAGVPWPGTRHAVSRGVHTAPHVCKGTLNVQGENVFEILIDNKNGNLNKLVCIQHLWKDAILSIKATEKIARERETVIDQMKG